MALDPSSPEMTMLLVMLHTGTMFAVIVYFWNGWRRDYFASSGQTPVVCDPNHHRDHLHRDRRLRIERIIIEKVFMRGTPHAEVEDLFDNLPLIAGALAAVGVLIIYAGLREEKTPRHSEIQPSHSVWIGIVQGICLPFRGFSRSGSTISTGLLLGLPKQKLEEFSFALAVVLTPPIIAKEAHRLLESPRVERARIRAASFFAGTRRDGFQFHRRIARVEMALALARSRTLEIFRLLLPDRGGGRFADSLQIPELNAQVARMKITSRSDRE